MKERPIGLSIYSPLPPLRVDTAIDPSALSHSLGIAQIPSLHAALGNLCPAR